MRDSIQPEIRVLAKGEKITEPGFYQCSLDVHHNQPCDDFSVTSSSLRTVELASPADFWAFHPLNPNRYERPETDALKLGRVMAALIEGGLEAMEEICMVLPSDKPRKPTAAQIDAYKNGRGTDAGAKSVEYWARMDADPRAKISEEQFELIIAMGKVLATDPAAQAALGGIPEITMAWKDEETGIWCLARPDQISFSGMVSDYKKIAPSGGVFNGYLVDSRITKHGYDMQMAFACQGFEELTRSWPDQVGLICQSDTPPHHVMLREIDQQDLSIGMFRNKRALRTIDACRKSGEWFGPATEVGRYIRPSGQMERLLEEMNQAGVAP